MVIKFFLTCAWLFSFIIANNAWTPNIQNPDNRVSSSQLPLSTESRWIVDSQGSRVKLTCVNWYGSEEKDYIVGGLQWQTIDTISSLIALYGFNCVRLPFSLEMVDLNPQITNTTKLLMEPTLYNKNALDVFDAVINSLTNNYNVMVILDNHCSDANWCCSETDGNGMWYTQSYSYQRWIELWQQMVTRYKSNSYVIGCDLRNELRSATINGKKYTPTWGTGDISTDWRLAAMNVSSYILSINPNLLILIEGLNYALDLTGVYNNPAVLSVSNKLVYSAHDYSWDHNGNSANYNQMSKELGDNWGYILTQGESYTAPVWIGEFGTCHYNSCIKDNTWWNSIREYIENADIDWSWWAMDGTESTGDGRTYGSEESYGILNLTWNGVASQLLLTNLQAIMNKTQGPRY